MNSVFNEHPSRKITDEFITKAIDEAQQAFQVIKHNLQLSINDKRKYQNQYSGADEYILKQ